MKDKQQTNFQNIIFLILLAFITGLLAYILKPFFFAVFWAILIASVFAPLYKFINKKIVNPNIFAPA